MKLLFIIDPIEHFKFYKDTTFALMLEAGRRSCDIHICLQTDLFCSQNKILANTREITVQDTQDNYFNVLKNHANFELSQFNIIFMRKDPPFDLNYIYTTYLLERVEKQGVKIINKPQSLRDCNEKLYTLQFPECTPLLTVSSQGETLKQFIAQHPKVVLKPLDSMGGNQIYLTHRDDPNVTVIIENLTKSYTTPIMAQVFIPEITKGDKRILLINGEPIKFALARVPQNGQIRGNLAAGGMGHVVPITKHDEWICAQLREDLVKRGLIFVGIDVIGDYLTEINITSPTCLREISADTGINIASALFEAL